MAKYDSIHLKEEDLVNQLKTQIGKVTLDYSHYPGEDYYCDGEVEDDLLSIVKEYGKVEYPGIIENRKSWPVLYHLSELRSNIVDWLPIQKGDKVLELGSGCGAITGKLAAKAGSVTCVDLSAKRSHINAYRNQTADNITIHVGNFKDIIPHLPKDYDYICLIGAFEYAHGYIGGETPYADLLRTIAPHLSPDGRIVIAIENKLGMKYFAGCKEDHLGTYYAGIENYREESGVRTFSRKGLQKELEAAGLAEYSFYYPYPDYKFMTTLYSDERLPMMGELSDNERNFDRDRMRSFHEKYAFDSVIADNMFPDFSNSFCVVTGKPFDIQYVKYSNDRDIRYAIKTEIKKRSDGHKIVRKIPLSDEAIPHIKNMQKYYEGLKKRYEGGPLQINECRLQEDGAYAEFPFVAGRTLAQLLDECLQKGENEKFHMLFNKYLTCISYGEQEKITDYDLIFANILVDEDQWTLIDYEWTVYEVVPGRELAFRAIYCYLLEEEQRNKLNLDLILQNLKITEEEAGQYREKEKQFQKQVMGKRKSMGELRILLGRHIVDVKELAASFIEDIRANQIQIYEDTGNGYSEESSWFYPAACRDQGDTELELKVTGDVKMLRIDPGMQACIVKIKSVIWNDSLIKINRRSVITNGKKIKNECYLFATQDPNININLAGLARQTEDTLKVRMEVVKLSEELARGLLN